MTWATARAYFFFNDTATTEIYTLSLHDALPISSTPRRCSRRRSPPWSRPWPPAGSTPPSSSPPTTSRRCRSRRSEEHTSELQSRQYLVCRLLLEKKKRQTSTTTKQTRWLAARRL